MKTASHSSSGRAGLRLSAFFQRTWLSEPLIFRSPIPGQSCSWCSRKGWVLLAATEQLGQNSGVEPQAGSDAHLVGHGPWWMTGHSGTASAFYASVAVQCVAPQCLQTRAGQPLALLSPVHDLSKPAAALWGSLHQDQVRTNLLFYFLGAKPVLTTETIISLRSTLPTLHPSVAHGMGQPSTEGREWAPIGCESTSCCDLGQVT